MIGLLIITHETLGAAYTRLARHFFPDRDFRHVRILSVENTHDHADIIRQAQTLLPETDCGHGTLILTDIFGATPCNAALKLVVPGRSAMLTGLNAPMLVKAANHSAAATDLAAFTETVRQAGTDGIMAFTEPLN